MLLLLLLLVFADELVLGLVVVGFGVLVGFVLVVVVDFLSACRYRLFMPLIVR